MRKIIMLLAIVSITALTATAQGKSDSLPKKDTVAVPVYVFEKSDTVKLETLLYKGEAGAVKYCSPGYVILKGQATTQDGKKYQWLAQPTVVGALDDKKRPVKPIIQ